MPRRADLSIAVVSFNTRDITLRCLAAVEAAPHVQGTHLVLADNGSADGTVNAVRTSRPAWHVLVNPDNPGYGAALNRAFRDFPAEFLLALNSDIVMRADSISRVTDYARHHPECGLLGLTLTHPDGRLQPTAKRFPGLSFALGEILGFHALLPQSRWVRRFYYANESPAGPEWVDTVSGAAMLIRGEAFRRIGGFDEGFRMYFEETDLCWRLREAGYRVGFCREASAIHCHGASTIQTTVRQVEYYLSYVRFFQKHHSSGAARILATAVFISTVLRMLALPLKYPPLSRRGLDILRPKLAACRRLLGALFLLAIGRASTERLP